MRPDQSRKIDALTMMAMAKAKKRQERRSVTFLIATAIVVVGLGVIGWFLWPEEPPRITLAAYDAVAAPGEKIVLRARAEPEAKDQSPKVSGLPVLFQIMTAQRAEAVDTDAQGLATLEWQASAKPEASEFRVRHQHKDNPKKVAHDQGNIFVWPADSSLLVVDVDRALVDGIENLAANANTAPTLRDGAAAALRSVGSRYKVVYLTAAVGEPTPYKKLRQWLQQSALTPQGKLPPGPLLAPSMPLGGDDGPGFMKDQIEALKKLFSGESVGIAGRNTEAQMFLDAGWKAVVIGVDNGLPAGATTAATWGELPKKLSP